MKLNNGEDIRSIVANSYTVSFNSLASSKLGLTSMLILYPNKLAINFAYSCCVFHWEIKYISTMMSLKKLSLKKISPCVSVLEICNFYYVLNIKIHHYYKD